MRTLFNWQSISSGLLVGLAIILLVNFFSVDQKLVYSVAGPNTVGQLAGVVSSQASQKINVPDNISASHLTTPKSVKALYLTSWAVSTPSLRDHVVNLLETTEANAVVIDVKDNTGQPAFKSETEKLNIKKFIAELHATDVYVIARIVAFQDSFLASSTPGLAIKRASDGAVWKDRKGFAWLDPGAKEVWDYVVQISREAEAVGFDELNFDHTRFPTDGDMTDIAYDFYDKTAKTKDEQLTEFYVYLTTELADVPVPLSVNLLGLTTTSKDNLNTGQGLAEALAYFDYVSPMIYPAQYPTTWNGFKNPAEKPYEVVKMALAGAIAKAELVASSTGASATTTKNKLRPWLQDFDVGAIYTADMVRAQMQAVYDAGLDSWMLWDPTNKYTPGGLLLNSDIDFLP